MTTEINSVMFTWIFLAAV